MAPSNKNDELISMEEGRSNIIVNLQQMTSSQTETSQPSNVNILSKTQKASYMLRRDEKIEKHFEPRMVSIGPLHHGDKFKLAENFNLKLAALFIKEHQLDKVKLYHKINEQIGNLRKCYIEEDIKSFKDGNLAWMFFVDGCALIHYIYCNSNDKLRDLKIKMDMDAFAQQDLFLPENQLPYQLLDPVLITSIPNQDQDTVRKSITKFVDKIARNIRGPSDDHVDTCCWKYISPAISKFIDKFVRYIKGRPSTPPSQPPPLLNPPAHLLELLWRQLACCKSSSAPDNKSSQKQNPNIRYTYRNVDELKAAWIRFKANTSGLLMDIAFGSFWFLGRTLTLPSLSVDDSTEPMFLNLIAFEICPDFENDFQISSCISFLDSLIDQQDDVRKLRKAHVLCNALGSNEQVARLFKEIGTDIVPNPRIYSAIKKEIQSHCKNKWNTWMGQIYHDHFSSPWTIVAFLGAVAALVMSGLQTWYASHDTSKLVLMTSPLS